MGEIPPLELQTFEQASAEATRSFHLVERAHVWQQRAWEIEPSQAEIEAYCEARSQGRLILGSNHHLGRSQLTAMLYH